MRRGGSSEKKDVRHPQKQAGARATILCPERKIGGEKAREGIIISIRHWFSAYTLEKEFLIPAHRA